jgi:hypothetical protein
MSHIIEVHFSGTTSRTVNNLKLVLNCEFSVDVNFIRSSNMLQIWNLKIKWRY